MTSTDINWNKRDSLLRFCSKKKNETITASTKQKRIKDRSKFVVMPQKYGLSNFRTDSRLPVPRNTNLKLKPYYYEILLVC